MSWLVVCVCSWLTSHQQLRSYDLKVESDRQEKLGIKPTALVYKVNGLSTTQWLLSHSCNSSLLVMSVLTVWINLFDTLMVFQRIFFNKVIIEKSQQTTKMMNKNYQGCKELTLCVPEAPKKILWQTAKTQMKCRMMRHFIRISSVR